MKKPKLWDGGDLLRVCRQIRIDDDTDFSFLSFCYFILDAKIQSYFSVRYSYLISDIRIKKAPAYYYGMRTMLTGQDKRIQRWKKKWPKEFQAIIKWDNIATREDIIEDMSAIRDILSIVEYLL
jgi:hypothetical protein